MAEIVIGDGEVTGATVIENGAEVAPAGIVMEAGTAAKAGAELNKATAAPPAGAGAARITAFDTIVPAPAMAEGASVTVSACAVSGVCSIFAERYEVVQERAHGSSPKSVGMDCAQGAALICR